MNIVTEINEWRAIRRTLNTHRIGFVPTMGHLHDGHLELCERSRAENDITIVSIFVNPTQFNQSSDFDRYPRTQEADAALLKEKGVDYLFVPDAKNMYPDQYEIKVTETSLSQELEGVFRPGHFDGMLTVVLKLLNLTQPSRAYFGEKDFQQLLLVKKMVDALFLPIDIVACETVRAPDGLALSSRNSRLTPSERDIAPQFPAALRHHQTPADAIAALESLGFKVDYVVDQWGRRLAAVWLRDVRLIDNIVLTH